MSERYQKAVKAIRSTAAEAMVPGLEVEARLLRRDLRSLAEFMVKGGAGHPGRNGRGVRRWHGARSH